MKKNLLIMTVLIMIILLSISSISNASINTDDLQIGDFYYRIISQREQTVTLTGVYDKTSLTTANIPSNIEIEGKSFTVKELDSNAFSECLNLTKVIIPNTVTSFGFYSTFYGCSSLTDIVIPDSVTNIGVLQTFSGCSSLKSINLPSNIRELNSNTFNSCSTLTSIIIPDKVTFIGSKVFYNCENLTNVTIPKSVTSIDVTAFDSCPNLVINAYKDSVAEEYADKYSIPLVLLSDTTEPSEEENPTPTTPPTSNNTKVGLVTIGGTNHTLSGAEIPNTDNIYAEMKEFLKEKGYKTVYCAYELSATGDTKDGVELTFDVGTENNGRAVMILHKKSNGNYETFERIVENGKVKITVTEFSPFMLAMADSNFNTSGGNTGTTESGESGNQDSSTEQNPTETTTTTTGTTTLKATTVDNEPKTGTRDYTIIATILAIVSLAGMIALKLKK